MNKQEEIKEKKRVYRNCSDPQTPELYYGFRATF